MSKIEQIPVVPAPWQLTGTGYILVVQLPKKVLDNESFIDEDLQASRRGRLAYIAVVDYQQSDAGPYQELLYIGGTLKFGDKRYHSISKIYVSTQSSIDNGRRNWGIPKEMAGFKVNYGTNNKDDVSLTAPNGDRIASLSFSHHLLPFPVKTDWVPKRLMTVGQKWQGQYFFFSPKASGYLKPALLTSSFFDKRYFPDLNQGRVLACFKVTDFSMIFPVPKTQAL